MDIRRSPSKTPAQPVKKPVAESVSKGRQAQQREVLKEVFIESEKSSPVASQKKVSRGTTMELPGRKKGVFIVLFVALLLGVGGWFSRDQISSIYIEAQNRSSGDISSDNSHDTELVVLEGREGIFDPEAFYGVETHDGTQYFARITLYDGHFYKLEDIFYDESERRVDDALFSSSLENATSTTSTVEELVEDAEPASGTITLVKFGTEEFQPDDTLLLPKDDVRQVFPLSPTSPIKSAIEEYLRQ